MALWHGLNDGQIELEYNPRHAVPDFQRHFEWREAESQRYRQNHGAPRSLAYGSGEREAVDLFPYAGSRTTLCFIHGGAWRAGSRANFHYMAPAMQAMGLSFASIGYPLAPQAGMGAMVKAVADAFTLLAREVSGDFILSGHSAGAQLASLLLLSHPAVGRVKGALLVSGLYDLGAVARTTINADVKLTQDEIASCTPFSAGQAWQTPTCAVVGALETDAFKEESRRILALAPATAGQYVALEGENHFSIVRQLADPASPLNAQVQALAAG